MTSKKVSVGHWPISILNGISSIINLLLPMFISRHVSSEEIGIYKIIFLYLGLVPALSLTAGIEAGIYYWSGLLNKSKEKIRAAWSLALIQSVLFFLVIVFFSPLLRPWLKWSWLQYISFSLASLTVVLASMYESILIANKKIWTGAIFSAIFNTISTIAMLIAILVYKSAVTITFAYAITMFIKIFVSYYLGVKEGWIPRFVDLREAKSVQQYYLPVSTSGLFDFLMSNSDRFLLSLLISPVQFAVYSFGCLAIPPLQILETSVTRVIIPQITTALDNKDNLHAAHLYRAGLEQIMLIFIPAFVGLFVFAEPIIKLLFTEKYIESIPFLRLYAIFILLSGIPYDIAARASGNGKWILKNTVRVGTFSIALCALLVWKFGAYGAISAMIATLIVQKSFGFNLMVNRYNWSLKEMIPFKSLSIYITLAGSLGIGSYLLKHFFINPITWFTVCSAPFAIIYLGSILFTRKELLEEIPLFHKAVAFFNKK